MTQVSLTARLTAALAAVLGIAAIAAGCGGSSSGGEESGDSSGPRTSVTASSISKAEYIIRANGVCEEAWPRMRTSFKQRYKGILEGKPFAAASKNIFLPSLQIQFDDIQYIGAPEGEEAQVEEMIGALQLAVFSAQEQTVSSPAQMAKIFADFNRLALAYGLDSCPVEEDTFAPSS